MDQAKKQFNDLSRKTKIEEELSELNSNKAALHKQAEEEARLREEMKQFWQEQLEKSDQQRQMEADAQNVLKKQLAV